MDIWASGWHEEKTSEKIQDARKEDTQSDRGGSWG